MPKNRILVLDFGSQYTQLIARRVRELNIYSEIHPYNKMPVIDGSWKAVILSGSPHSVREENAPIPDLSKIKKIFPLLGVCYGAQFLANNYGGEVLPSKHREYGRARLNYIDQSKLNIKAGFIHVPFMDESKPNNEVFSLPLDVIVEAVIDIIKTVL